ncbi:MAG: hypothetical protein LBD51_01085 [Bifidobacteriaceae bacterium]|jgi:hypothetical protein|nr:hypothetical protein [Bifidobacteriaceae bacterium]
MTSRAVRDQPPGLPRRRAPRAAAAAVLVAAVGLGLSSCAKTGAALTANPGGAYRPAIALGATGAVLDKLAWEQPAGRGGGPAQTRASAEYGAGQSAAQLFEDDRLAGQAATNGPGRAFGLAGGQRAEWQAAAGDQPLISLPLLGGIAALVAIGGFALFWLLRRRGRAARPGGPAAGGEWSANTAPGRRIVNPNALSAGGVRANPVLPSLSQPIAFGSGPTWHWQSSMPGLDSRKDPPPQLAPARPPQPFGPAQTPQHFVLPPSEDAAPAGPTGPYQYADPQFDQPAPAAQMAAGAAAGPYQYADPQYEQAAPAQPYQPPAPAAAPPPAPPAAAPAQMAAGPYQYADPQYEQAAPAQPYQPPAPAAAPPPAPPAAPPAQMAAGAAAGPYQYADPQYEQPAPAAVQLPGGAPSGPYQYADPQFDQGAPAQPCQPPAPQYHYPDPQRPAPAPAPAPVLAAVPEYQYSEPQFLQGAPAPGQTPPAAAPGGWLASALGGAAAGPAPAYPPARPLTFAPTPAAPERLATAVPAFPPQVYPASPGGAPAGPAAPAWARPLTPPPSQAALLEAYHDQVTRMGNQPFPGAAATGQPTPYQAWSAYPSYPAGPAGSADLAGQANPQAWPAAPPPPTPQAWPASPPPSPQA